MFNWLYAKAKQFKKIALFVSGAGVGASTATALVSSATSWAMNLVAIISSGAYSVLKNMEVAESVADRQRNTTSIIDELSLKKYQSGQTLSGVLHEVTDFSEEEIQHIELETHKEFAKGSQRYANCNFLVQGALGAALFIVNVIANTASENKDDPSNAKNIANMSCVPLCILLQCLFHIIYAAKNLRRNATESEDLRVKLSDVHKSSFFRVRELRAFRQRKLDVEREIGQLSREITLLEQRNAEIEKQRTTDMLEYSVVRKNRERLSSKFEGINVEKYLSVGDQDQLMYRLMQDFPDIKNISELAEYINTTRIYSQLSIKINVENRELSENKISLEHLFMKYEDSKRQHQKLETEEPKFRQVEADLVRLERMQHSF